MAAVTIFQGTDPAIPQLRQFGQSIGLAFQVQDDILDVIADTAVLGKTAGKDQQVDKSTYPALLGLEAAQAYARQLHDQAFTALDALGSEWMQQSFVRLPRIYSHEKVKIDCRCRHMT